MLKILVLTDSLGLPRDIPEEVLYEGTWPQKLSNEYIVLQSSIGGGTTYDLNKQASYLRMFKPDIVIIQVGIVDCAPRALTYHENIIGNYFWLTRKFLNFFLPIFGNNIRNLRNVTYVKITEFEKNLKGIIDILPDSEFITLGILPPSIGYEELVPGISKRIFQYNQILKKVFINNYLSLDDIHHSFIMSDFHHLNYLGHSFVFEKLLQNIKNRKCFT